MSATQQTEQKVQLRPAAPGDAAAGGEVMRTGAASSTEAAVTAAKQCALLADRCPVCGERLGWILGFKGLGMRQRNHLQRCTKRRGVQVPNVQDLGQDLTADAEDMIASAQSATTGAFHTCTSLVSDASNTLQSEETQTADMLKGNKDKTVDALQAKKNEVLESAKAKQEELCAQKDKLLEEAESKKEEVAAAVEAKQQEAAAAVEAKQEELSAHEDELLKEAAAVEAKRGRVVCSERRAPSPRRKRLQLPSRPSRKRLQLPSRPSSKRQLLQWRPSKKSCLLSCS
eukprot:TRINITY_DN317_c0_g1_i7.p1 TRINITY_DN317_c0_g1~~TRINITY_DN317_c0_g1_i7.p1  ORF type:complete len:286 (+),score=114.33 TRINITY_DN317_c0_g1_i7:97-954(+)